MRHKKIIHLISSLKMGGAEILLSQLIPAFAKQGYAQEVVYFHDGPIRKRIEVHGIPLHHIKGLLCPYDPLFFWRLASVLRVARPCVIHASLWAACFLGRLLAWVFDIPMVSVVHAQPSHAGVLRTVCDRLTAPLEQQTVAVSSVIATNLIAARLVQPNRVTVIENGIDWATFAYQSAQEKVERAALGYADTDFIIGAVGRLVPVKNYSLLIKAYGMLWQEFPYAKLLIIGSGPELYHLQALIKTLPVGASAHIIANDTSAYGYYHLFNCFVLPSFTEGLSMALLEAMGTSCPCIVTSLTRYHPAIEHRHNGLVIPPDNLVKLMAALKSFIKNDKLARQYGSQAAKDVIKNFSLDTVVARYGRVLQR
jgi:L-malate glycosyltransferase